ncbi:CPBP family intramembrane glutamic endopeptidase [Youxingia wuxianensis]|uniref:CPBP family intramembrane metalloprotease n=1 Tax=Youxingia wuxianensis TaxID=2763678 RepID=A0A926EQ45_9FIRM|nr:type II CAAX endopeptidase family protein [Youxingia wuxianensis]MBC8585347.1 CPBP family intramembrane metalloprotease [Youxingia wuxianensis]
MNDYYNDRQPEHSDSTPPEYPPSFRGGALPPYSNDFLERHKCALVLKGRSNGLALTIIVSLLILYLFQLFGFQIAYFLLDLFTFQLLPVNTVYEMCNTALYVIVFFLPYLVYAAVIKYPFMQIPHDPPKVKILLSCTGVTLGASVVGMLTAMVAAVFFSLFGLFPMEVPFYLPPEPSAAVLYILNSTLVPAVIEEAAYRGIVLGSLRQFGDRFAIVVSALLFGLLHRNMTQFPNAFLLGILLGYFMVKTNSIWTSMFIHFTNNFLIILFTIATYHLSQGPYLAAQGALYLFYLCLGGAGIFYLTKVRRLDMTLYRIGCPLSEKELYRRYLVNVPMIMLMLLFGWLIYLNFTKF